MIVLCLGMQGSASTWVFNVVRDLVAAAAGPVQGFEATSLAAVEAALQGNPASLVIRAHNATPALLALVRAAGGHVVLTTRDPRDCVASLVTRLGGGAADWAMDVARSLASVGVVLGWPGQRALAFEDAVTCDPATGPALAAQLGLGLDPAESRRIAAGWSLGKVRARIAAAAALRGSQAAGFGSDPETGFNSSHLGDGRVGKWADTLAPAEAAAVDRAFGGLAWPQRGVRPGDVIRFGEALFSPGVRQDDAAEFPPGPFGSPALRFCYLAAGPWRLTLRGRLPGVAASRWLSLFVAGRRVQALLLEASPEGESQEVALSLLLDHRGHEDMIEAWLETPLGGLPDPRRPGALELAAERLASVPGQRGAGAGPGGDAAVDHPLDRGDDAADCGALVGV